MSLTYTAPPASPTLDTGNSLYGNILSMIVIDPSQNVVELKASGGTFSYVGAGSHSFVADGGGYKLRVSGGTYLREGGLTGLGGLTNYTLLIGCAMTTMSSAYSGVAQVRTDDETQPVIALAMNGAANTSPLAVFAGAGTQSLTGATALIPNALVGRGYSVVGLTLGAGNNLTGWIDGTADTGNVGALSPPSYSAYNIDILGNVGSAGDFYWFLLLNTQLNSTQMSSIAANPWQLLVAAPIALAGSASGVAAASAGLTTGIQLAGNAAGLATAQGSITGVSRLQIVLTDANDSPRPNLTGIRHSVWAETQANALATKLTSGTNGTTDSNGQLTISVPAGTVGQSVGVVLDDASGDNKFGVATLG